MTYKKEIQALKKDVEQAIQSLKKAKRSESPQYMTPLENGLLVTLKCFKHWLEQEEKLG